MFVKMSLRDRLAFLLDFVELTLLCVLLLPNCFLNAWLPTLFAPLLKFSLPFTIFAISGAASAIKSTSTLFAAGTTYLRKNGICFPQ